MSLVETTIEITRPQERTFENVYQFKVSLKYTAPEIWRSIQIPESYTFYDFHVAIQDAMGWTDSHLHMFRMKTLGGSPIVIHSPYVDPELEDDDFLIDTEIFIKDYLSVQNDIVLYEYDFGDSWLHEIQLEKIVVKETNKRYPLCLGGKLSCPPEDCGSIPGYNACVKAWEKKDNSDGLLDWFEDWEPDSFDSKKVVFESPIKRFDYTMMD